MEVYLSKVDTTMGLNVFILSYENFATSPTWITKEQQPHFNLDYLWNEEGY